ncbi:serine hydrolase domain-containing protein [Sandarakinorhabdus limnophila]|uniref:serine hydrolase domain-containing protein n=1 Tax=Sandarakinorhabdus limnophila TaxID=210512 RepID=UPI0026EB5A76|nr:serine hydrolase domain-containing protein [Sandarakinorhabdus limnophila]
MYKTARMFCAPIGRLFWAIPITLCLSMQLIAPAFAQAIRRDLLQTEVASDPRPMALFVTGQGVASAYAVSTAGKSGKAGSKPLGPDTPVRVASNTKTFVAATVLRLWEQGRIDLDAAIGPLLTPRLDALMRSGGYDTARITVRQLLSHSAGIYDHAQDERYLSLVFSQPGKRWSREDQVSLAVKWGKPLDPPGTAFHYSDTGYILVGDIVERITGQSLGKAVRTQLRLDRLKLRSTWWEILEDKPRRAPARARQFIGNTEVTDLDASVDLHGGGGLVMSAKDLAKLMAALFEGGLFERPGTLQEMLWQGPHKGADGYRLGVFVKHADGRDYYWHSGYWGTVAYYAPAARIAVAGVTTNQDAYRRLVIAVQKAAGVTAP